MSDNGRASAGYPVVCAANAKQCAAVWTTQRDSNVPEQYQGWYCTGNQEGLGALRMMAPTNGWSRSIWPSVMKVGPGSALLVAVGVVWSTQPAIVAAAPNSRPDASRIAFIVAPNCRS